MQISDCDKQIMVRTARSSGAVGKQAILPRFISSIKGLEDHLVLDFGCGKDAVHVEILRKQGFPYAYGIDLQPLTNPRLEAPEDMPWHLVYASNVLNVQPSEDALKCTLCKLSELSKLGVAFLSYPKSPRKLNLTVSQMQEKIEPFFVATYNFKYRNTTIFKCVGRKCQKKLEERLTVDI